VEKRPKIQLKLHKISSKTMPILDLETRTLTEDGEVQETWKLGGKLSETTYQECTICVMK
jgi:hypothetical protein